MFPIENTTAILETLGLSYHNLGYSIILLTQNGNKYMHFFSSNLTVSLKDRLITAIISNYACQYLQKYSRLPEFQPK